VFRVTAPAHLSDRKKVLWDELEQGFDLSLGEAQQILKRAVVAIDRARMAAVDGKSRTLTWPPTKNGLDWKNRPDPGSFENP
jgi:hypothetical protein